MSQPPKIGIVGGGIAGLSTAWRLRKCLPNVRIVVMEATDRLGGFLQTEHVGGYLIDTSADMFTTEPPAALELCRQLGRAQELICTLPVRQRAYIATQTGICPVPNGFSLMLPTDLQAVIDSQLLDESGKSRFLAEETIPPIVGSDDECLKSFAVRRFGQQVFDRLIQPLVSGIYTADPGKLSMQATMARFVEMERQHGSLIAAGRQKPDPPGSDQAINAEQSASGARYDLFRAPVGGMGQLIDWITADLDEVEIRTNFQVERISRQNSGWQLESGPAEAEPFDGLVLSTPSNVAAKLLADVDQELAIQLASIERSSFAIVVIGLDVTQLKQGFDGYGIVVPDYLNRKLIAASFSSNKFPGRAPEGKLLVRCFVGGALRPELVDLSDEELVELVQAELLQLVESFGSPELTRVYRWPHSMPQYHVGHRERIQRIRRIGCQTCRIGIEWKQLSGRWNSGLYQQRVCGGRPNCGTDHQNRVVGSR